MVSARHKRPSSPPVGAAGSGGRFAIVLDGTSWLVWDVLAQRPARVGTIERLPRGPLALALSADGGVLLVGGADGTVAEVELATGRARWTVRAHRAPVVALALDGARVTSLAADGTVWTDPQSAKPERPNSCQWAGRVVLAVGIGAAVSFGWLPALALAAVPALLGFKPRRRFRLRLSLGGSEHHASDR